MKVFILEGSREDDTVLWTGNSRRIGDAAERTAPRVSFGNGLPPKEERKVHLKCTLSEQVLHCTNLPHQATRLAYIEQEKIEPGFE